MNDTQLRTLTAAVILGGLLANKETAGNKDSKIQNAIDTADKLLKALQDPAKLLKRIDDFQTSRGYPK